MNPTVGDGVLDFMGYVLVSGTSDRQCIGCGLRLSQAITPFIHKKGCKWMRSVRALINSDPYGEPRQHNWCCPGKHVQKPSVPERKFLSCGCFGWCSCGCPNVGATKFLY